MSDNFWPKGSIIHSQEGPRITERIVDPQAATLRDTFACAAMQGFLFAAGDIGEDALSTMVRGSYMVADAMMAERAKK